ncbi:MAG: hypothetical protein QOJ15_2864 [Bradyrhizobium sp.]|jgi:hypothetical protein|nr:hypothetical protein [Bradyrhizobium sp.]
MEKLRQLVDLAERICLSSHKKTDTVGISLTLAAIKQRLTSGVGLERQATELRGASEQLTGAVAQLENDQIRTCMNEKLAPAFAQVTTNFLTGDASVAWPEPIEFRFRFARVTSTDPKKYSENLRVALLRSSRSPVTRRITFQPDAAGPYYQLDIPYPASSELIKGTIAPEIIATSTLSIEPTSLTPICLQRPSSFPQVKAEYDVFECIEGDLCRSAAFGTTGWLAICPKSGEAVPPVKPSRYADFLIARAQAATVERRWVVPSLETLSEQNAEGVGYTVFTLSTAAFRKSEALGVEIDVRVNGTRVEEDGLPPALRPVANDPSQPFRHSFALQSLDFQGLHGGCDEISVGLTPIYGGGRKGDPRTVTLSYAALRDVEERKVPFAGDTLTWWASYITPAREWRYFPIVHSYIYAVNDPKQAASAAAKAEADRRWLDEQRFSYQGQRVLGVVRPPRTIQKDGTAAFGLTAGLLQPTGQIRFTFPQADARSMADFMVKQRRGGEADRVIEADKYIFQAVGGYRTVKGVCGTG